MEKHSYFNALNRAFLILKERNVDESVASYLLEEMMNWTPTKYSINKNNEMSDVNYQKFMELINRAKNNEPAQYILGEAWFYGRKFMVTKDTLIPRQETEELVQKVLDDINKETNLSILDIGTGTGDIPITLDLEHPGNKILATDIDKNTLNVARKNSDKFNTQIKFIYSDLFENVDDKFDIIISNPPYISEDERDVMDKSVLNYEPNIALFAEDEGLILYKKIFSELDNYLDKDGRAYFEFGYHQKDRLSELINNLLPEYSVHFYKDISDNWRYLKLNKKKG